MPIYIILLGKVRPLLEWAVGPLSKILDGLHWVSGWIPLTVMTTREDLWCQLNSPSSKTKMTYTLYLKVGSCDSFSDIWSSLGVRKF